MVAYCCLFIANTAFGYTELQTIDNLDTLSAEVGEDAATLVDYVCTALGEPDCDAGTAFKFSTTEHSIRITNSSSVGFILIQEQGDEAPILVNVLLRSLWVIIELRSRVKLP